MVNENVMILTNEQKIQRDMLGEYGFHNQITLFDDLCTAICRLDNDMDKYAVFACDAQEQRLTRDSKVIVFPDKIEYSIWEQYVENDMVKAIESIVNHVKAMQIIEQRKAENE